MVRPKSTAAADNDDHDNDEDDSAAPAATLDVPVYPLFPEQALGTVEYLVVHRVLETNAERPNFKPRSPAWPKRFDPLTTDELSVAEECGGGSYDVMGRNAKGHTVCGTRIELLGEPKQPKGLSAVTPLGTTPAPQPSFAQQAQQSQDPIQQTPSGAMAIRGADPNTNAVLAMLQAQAQQQQEQQRLDRERQAEQARIERERWEKLEEQRRLDREEERKKEAEREERRRQENEARLKEERDRAERETIRVREDADRRAKEQQANSDRMMQLFIEASKPQSSTDSLVQFMLNAEKQRNADLERRLEEQRRMDDKRREDDEKRRKEDLAAAKAARELAEKTADKREERESKRAESDNIMGTVEKIILGVAAMPAVQAKLGETLAPAVAEVLKPVAQSVIATVMNDMANAQPALPAPPVEPSPSFPDPSAYTMPATDGATNGAPS
jgi:hypothetical protein